MYSILYYFFNNNPYRKFCIEKENAKIKSMIKYDKQKYNIIINKYVDLREHNFYLEDKYIDLEDKYIDLENKHIDLENKYSILADKYEKLINISFNYNEDDIVKYEDFDKVTNNSFIYNEDGNVEKGEYDVVLI